MDSQMIFLAGLQVAYWLWGGIFQPAAVRFGTKVADAFGDVVVDGIYDLFGRTAPVQNSKLEESQAQQKELEKTVLPRLKSNPVKAEQLLQDIQTGLVILLRDPNYFDMDDLNIIWMDVLDPAVDWKIKIIASPSQASIAGDLVRRATQLNKLADLISAMRKLRKE